jgi:hypothetical protein
MKLITLNTFKYYPETILHILDRKTAALKLRPAGSRKFIFCIAGNASARYFPLCVSVYAYVCGSSENRMTLSELCVVCILTTRQNGYPRISTLCVMRFASG